MQFDSHKTHNRLPSSVSSESRFRRRRGDVRVRRTAINTVRLPLEEALERLGASGEFPINNIHVVSLHPFKNPFTEFDEGAKKLVLIRGLPGSGKTTLARAVAQAGFRHFETDMYFERNGEYYFNPRKLAEAHAWCLQLARRSIKLGSKVVIANTFSKMCDLLPYLNLVPSAVVIETGGSWTSVHGVSC